MNIAIVGTRGIPNQYGGFEAFAEHLSQRLADRGHNVRVYCRKPFTSPSDVFDQRIRRVILPSLRTKHLDTPINTFLAAVHVSFSDADVIVMVNVANSLWAWIPRLAGKPVILNVDGLDRRRKKWGPIARGVLRVCEWISLVTPNRVVTDAQTVKEYYSERYGKRTTKIGYGAEVPATGDGDELARYGLIPNQYFLYVSRLEKENNPELVIQEYNATRSPWPLVVVGGNTYDESYVQRLKSLAGPGVIFCGPIYGNGYWTLQRNAGVFIFACEIGGVHPALVESMAAGRAVLFLDTAANRETAGDCALPFSPEANDLANGMKRLMGSESLRTDFGAKAAERARLLYGWEQVATEYEDLCVEVLRKGRAVAAGTAN
jgi:glycosyltransferase involved in cell wall biosynthesis